MISALRLRIEDWLAGSLTHRFSALALTIIFVIVAPLGSVAYAIIHHLLSQKIEAELHNVVGLRHYGLEQSLREVNADVKSMAQRSLVTNAIADSEGRDAYLVPFLREYVAADARIAAVNVHDYMGRAVITVGGSGPAGAMPEISRAISSEKPLAAVVGGPSGQQLLVAAPIFFPPTQSVEGALSVRIDLATLFHRYFSSVPAHHLARLLDAQGREVARSGEAQASQISIALPLADDSGLRGYRIAIGVDASVAYRSLDWLAVGFVVVGVLTLVLAYRLSRRAAERLTRGLRELSGAAREIEEGGRGERLHDLPTDGKDEIATLTLALSRMMRALRSAHAALEARVETRTQQLAETQGRLAAILDSLRDVVYSVAPDFSRLLYISPSVADLTGTRFTGTPSLRRLAAHFHREDGRAVRRAYLRAVAGGQCQQRYRIVRSDGSVRWVQDRFHVVLDEAGRPLRIDGIVTDVTDKVHAEEARARTEAVLHLKDRALEASCNGIVIADMSRDDSPIIYVNPAFERITGYAADEVLGRNCRFLQGDDAASPEVAALRHAIASERETQVVLRNFRKDGQPFWNELSVSPVRDPVSGRLTHYVGIQNDITARRTAERQTYEWFVRLETIFTLSPDGFVSFDSGGRLAFVNPAFERMTGFIVADLVGLGLEQLDERMRALSDPAQPYPPVQADLDENYHDPRRRHRRRSVTMLRPAPRVLSRSVRRVGSSNTAFVLYFRDITRETEVDRMKSEFLSTAAHELRTPMASIMGFSELLLTRKYDEHRTRDLLETINRQAGRLTALLNELLDLARIEARAGKDLDRVRQPLGPIVRDTLAAFMVPGDNRAIDLSGLGPLPEVMVDAAKIQQALTNVIGNAYKYSPDGGSVCLASVQHDGEVGLRVSDEGIGMTPEQQARAFERFYRADSSGNIPGTGLGLSLVKEIIELHAGRVELESEAGVGTTLTLWLPLPPAASPEDRPAGESLAPVLEHA
ncbi:PAS domain S-box protein [Zoogloea sp.]|uniref:PAS domain S-box protein n=1 Tax=Zoogloea sp. TaxID=49181 RepID=UPI0035B1050C